MELTLNAISWFPVISFNFSIFSSISFLFISRNFRKSSIFSSFSWAFLSLTSCLFIFLLLSSLLRDPPIVLGYLLIWKKIVKIIILLLSKNLMFKIYLRILDQVLHIWNCIFLRIFLVCYILLRPQTNLQQLHRTLDNYLLLFLNIWKKICINEYGCFKVETDIFRNFAVFQWFTIRIEWNHNYQITNMLTKSLQAP